MQRLPVFVYGTLRPGSWNHDRWLAPWLAAPCRPASLRGHALHHHDGLPYLVPDTSVRDDVVVGDVADVDPDRYDDAMAALDELEGVDIGHLVRVEVELVGGEPAWAYVAGPLVADALGPDTHVVRGDWLSVG
jgi:periplasmic divalent cation tolerance protein